MLEQDINPYLQDQGIHNIKFQGRYRKALINNLIHISPFQLTIEDIGRDIWQYNPAYLSIWLVDPSERGSLRVTISEANTQLPETVKIYTVQNMGAVLLPITGNPPKKYQEKGKTLRMLLPSPEVQAIEALKHYPEFQLQYEAYTQHSFWDTYQILMNSFELSQMGGYNLKPLISPVERIIMNSFLQNDFGELMTFEYLKAVIGANSDNKLIRQHIFNIFAHCKDPRIPVAIENKHGQGYLLYLKEHMLAE